MMYQEVMGTRQARKWIEKLLIFNENTTVTTHRGNTIDEKRSGSAISFHGPGSRSFLRVTSP
jgi:hypothetical protein